LSHLPLESLCVVHAHPMIVFFIGCIAVRLIIMTRHYVELAAQNAHKWVISLPTGYTHSTWGFLLGKYISHWLKFMYTCYLIESPRSHTELSFEEEENPTWANAMEVPFKELEVGSFWAASVTMAFAIGHLTVQIRGSSEQAGQLQLLTEVAHAWAQGRENELSGSFFETHLKEVEKQVNNQALQALGLAVAVCILWEEFFDSVLDAAFHTMDGEGSSGSEFGRVGVELGIAGLTLGIVLLLKKYVAPSNTEADELEGEIEELEEELQQEEAEQAAGAGTDITPLRGVGLTPVESMHTVEKEDPPTADELDAADQVANVPEEAM